MHVKVNRPGSATPAFLTFPPQRKAPPSLPAANELPGGPEYGSQLASIFFKKSSLPLLTLCPGGWTEISRDNMWRCNGADRTEAGERSDGSAGSRARQTREQHRNDFNVPLRVADAVSRYTVCRKKRADVINILHITSFIQGVPLKKKTQTTLRKQPSVQPQLRSTVY